MVFDMAGQSPMVDLRGLAAAPAFLFGRDEQLRCLDDVWIDPAVRLVSIVAPGGVGKTSLAISWWHRNGVADASRVLIWSFSSEGAGDGRQVSADTFLDHALREWFSTPDPAQDQWKRGEQLAQLIQPERILLILDGLESLQFISGRLRDPGMVALLQGLSESNQGVCICTSRLVLTDLEDKGNIGVLHLDLNNLSVKAGARYLEHLNVKGDETELQRASFEVANHPLALTLLGGYLVKYCGGDVRRRDTIRSILASADLGDHTRSILRQYEELFAGTPELSVLRLLGLFDRPVDADAWRVLRLRPAISGLTDEIVSLSQDDWNSVTKNLAAVKLIECSDSLGQIDCHPLIREYFGDRLRTTCPEGVREANFRLYAYYSAQSPDQPSTLAAMTPLFYAVYHGCQAGLHSEVRREYARRILRDDKFFLWHQLGALNTDLTLLANFFVQPWDDVVPNLSPYDRAWVAGQAGFVLRAVGRMQEAIRPTQTGAESLRDQGEWSQAAICFRNLGQILLIVGDIPRAVLNGRYGVSLSDRGGDPAEQMFERVFLADALHQAGELHQAEALFQEAESRQRTIQPSMRQLYSVQGYNYCDLLLSFGRNSDVLNRARRSLAIATHNGWLLDIGLDNLCLGRADRVGSATSGGHLMVAVDSLRRASILDYLPPALLARASHFRQTNNLRRAQADLDEARSLCDRTGMLLHRIDCHLEQVRLFLAQNNIDQSRIEHLRATRLIQESGYKRREAALAKLDQDLV